MRLNTAIARYATSVSSLTLGACLFFVTAPASAEGLELPHSIRIGILNDRSGAYADATGEGSAVAARMAAEEFGSRIMGQPIEIIIGDHGNKADLGALLARKWFDEQNVDVIADVANSGVGLAVVALASPRNRIVLNNSAASEFTGKACSASSVQWSYNSDASATALATALMKRGLDSLYMISADYAYGRTITTELKTLMQQSGGKVVGEVFHPLNTSEFSSFLLQAQGSGAKAVGVGSCGNTMVELIKQAGEFQIASKQTLVAGCAIDMSQIEGLGLSAAQGLIGVSAFEWQRSPESEKWARDFFKRTGRFPTADQAATYSEVRHYLRAVEAAKTLDGPAVMAKMRELPVNDAYADNGHLREDGQLVHDLYLVRIKAPDESKEKGDYDQILQVLPGDTIFPPLSESACPLVKK